MKTITKMVATALLLSLTLNSCLMTKTPVGAYPQTQGKETTYAKGKQIWLFWGTLPLGRTSVNTPTDGNCLVVTKYNFGDVLISSLTGGIVMTYTIKVKVKKPVAEKSNEGKNPMKSLFKKGEN
jgi:hypothetical protein